MSDPLLTLNHSTPGLRRTRLVGTIVLTSFGRSIASHEREKRDERLFSTLEEQSPCTNDNGQLLFRIFGNELIYTLRVLWSRHVLVKIQEIIFFFSYCSNALATFISVSITQLNPEPYFWSRMLENFFRSFETVEKRLGSSQFIFRTMEVQTVK